MDMRQVRVRCASRDHGARPLRPGVEAVEARQLLAASVTLTPLPTPTSQPGPITLGPDGSTLWFIDNGSSASTFPLQSEIGSINPATHAVQEYPLPTGVTVSALTSGPGGLIWFAGGSVDPVMLESTDIIGSFDPHTDAIQTYPISEAASPGTTVFEDINSIVTGSDGKLWFTESQSGAIGRFDPATKTATNFTIPGGGSGVFPGAEPQSIVSGPRGLLWFTVNLNSSSAATSGAIDSLDPATGAFARYPLATIPSSPYQITVGSDGAIWYTDIYTNAIGRFDPTTHASAEYAAPVAGIAGPISAGPGGLVWFASTYGSAIGSIDPITHQFTDYSLPATDGNSTTSLAAGSGSSLWFNLSNPSSIGELTTPAGVDVTLVPSANPTPMGRPVTLTATAPPTPGGVVTFLNSSSILGASLVGPDGTARLTVSSLGFGLSNLSAVYSTPGSASFIVTPFLIEQVTGPDGPRVTGVQRLGYHRQPTTLVVGFDEPLLASTAQDPANYRITGPRGRSVVIKSAVYDPTADSVVLTPKARLDVHASYQLTVVGTGGSGVKDTSGRVLDGQDIGQPGSDYVTTITRADLVPTVATTPRFGHSVVLPIARAHPYRASAHRKG